MLDKEDFGGMYVCNLDLSPDTEGEIELRFAGEKHPDNSEACEDDVEMTAPFVGAILFDSKIGKGSPVKAEDPFPNFDGPLFLGKGCKGDILMSDCFERSGRFVFKKL